MLSAMDITKIVTGYIGVKDGYLGDFSYKDHREFYPIYCDLDINPEEHEGTTRERFIEVLKSQNTKDQVKILKGILEKYPFENFEKDEQKTKLKHYQHIQELIKKLDKPSIVNESNPIITSETVQKAIDDTRILLQKNGATSAIDRIHTALHGHLKAICKQENITLSIKDPTLVNLFKEIRKSPKFNMGNNRIQDLNKIANSISNILDALNPIRNTASIAHPNENLLDEAEASLVINTSQTILHYLDSKFSNQ